MRRLFRLQKCILFLLAASFLLGMILGVGVLTSTDMTGGLLGLLKTERKGIDQVVTMKMDPKTVPLSPPVKPESTEKSTLPKPNYNLHAFYYPWYGNPEFDGEYLHWNHPLMPHWDKKEAAKWPSGRHEPPDDIGAGYFPELGAYSSRDPKVIDAHMEQARTAGIGVLAVSWYNPSLADDNGKPWDNLMPALLDSAHKYQLKISFHLEPYKKRTHKTVRSDIQLIMQKYGSHPALYRHTWRGQQLPLYYIYDSYLIGKDSWGAVFRPDGALSVRGTSLDGIFIGLLVEDKHRLELVGAGFDGFYTYFASDGFSYGSSTRHWGALSSYANTNGLLFIPSAGPGYVDVRVRPWNQRNTKDRENGGYYEQSLKAALAANPPIITITSFNEWHEGTQIEKAIPHTHADYTYKDYRPMTPDFYLTLTRKWSFKYKKLLRGQS